MVYTVATPAPASADSRVRVATPIALDSCSVRAVQTAKLVQDLPLCGDVQGVD